MAFSLFSRNCLRCVRSEEAIRRIQLTPLSFDEDESSKKSSAAHKLHSLLQDIIKDETLSKENAKLAGEVNIAFKKRKRPERPKDLGGQIVDSAKAVAKELGGKPEETEAQLLHRVLYKNKSLTESVTKAVGSDTLKELLAGMEVEKTEKPKKPPPSSEKEFTRADQIRFMLGKKKSFKPYKSTVTGEKVNIFGGERLNIFKPDDFKETDVPMDTWEDMKKKELRLLVTQPPRNIYEQMIQWTEKGMLWKFPIDNEQGLEEEAKVDFSEHIFLENHLEEWCPEKGPVRHFMELVCVGLSRNHWLTVDEKKQHILWYKDYFTEKRALLLELEAGEIKSLAAK